MTQYEISGTFLVLGTYNFSHERHVTRMGKYVQCVGASGKKVHFEFCIQDETYEAAYIERGDIIEIKNGCLVRNLTTDVLKTEFLNPKCNRSR